MIPANSPNSVLLLHSGALGDFVLAYHLVRALVNEPRRQLCAIARHPIATWFKDHELLREGLLEDAAALHTLYGDASKPAARLEKYLARFSLVISMLGGVETDIHHKLFGLCHDRLHTLSPQADGSRTHIVDQWRRQISRRYGYLPPELSQAELLSEVARAGQRELLRVRLGMRGDRVLVIHPGSGGRSKCAPRRCFAKLRDEARHAGWTVAWMIGPVEVERHGCPWDDELTAGDCLICEPSIGRAANLLAGADAFCGNDGGMAHLAAGLGLPTGVWFGPTDPAVWKPIGRQVCTFKFDEHDPPDLAARTIRAMVKALGPTEHFT
jgi:ADP-heptose:LPS heptosyltransferase